MRPKPTTERLTRHRRAREVIGLRARINALAEQLVAERDVACDGEQQAEADVRCGVGDDRRNVGDRDAETGGGRKVDTILRDVHRRYGLQVRIGLEHIGVDNVMQKREQDVAALHAFDQSVLWEHLTGVGVDLDIRNVTQTSQCALSDRLSDKNTWTHHGQATLAFGGGTALTFGITFSARSCIERLASVGSRQSFPA